MTGEGRSYKERQRERDNFLDCRKDLERVSLDVHFQTQHGVTKGGSGQGGDKEGGGSEPITFRMAFTEKVGPRP